jgi:PsbP
VKARFTSEDGSCLVTVISREASEMRPTFFQLTDIGQYGSAEEVARMLAPRDSKLVAASEAKVTMPSRDTGTILGTVKVPDQTIYRYEFVARGQHVAVAAAAKQGRVYVAGASSSEERWPEVGSVLKSSIGSFTLNLT